MWLGIAALGLAIVGTTIYRFTAPSQDKVIKTSGDSDTAWWRAAMMMVVSLLVLGAGLYVILKGGYDDGVQKWAFGAIGLIVGFWLKSK